MPLFALVLTAPLFACQSAGGPTTTVASTVAFDPAQAAFIKKSGSGKIEGHAFWRTGEGTTINAAGEIIRLVPATPYARERFTALYGGARSVAAGAIPKTETDPGYADYTRTTRAESSGHFEFDGLAPGTYYVTAQIVYKDSSQVLKAQARHLSEPSRRSASTAGPCSTRSPSPARKTNLSSSC